MPKFFTGAQPSPKYKAFATHPHVAQPGVPTSFGIIPAKLQYWGNNQYGDCVSAEEAAAKAIYSVMFGATSEVLIPDQTLISWASQHGWLNGANLTDVMDGMIKDGITVNGQLYKDGPYQSVDWTNDTVLSSAIFQGPVKIGIAAGQLQNVTGVGQTNGWIATGFGNDNNEDHSVCLCGFGTAQELATMLNVTLPASLSPTTRCYLLFTWSTIGIIDQKSMINITGEAWLRLPTSIPGPVPPTPTPTPPPGPTPTPVPTQNGVITIGVPEGSVIVDTNAKVVSIPSGWTFVPFKSKKGKTMTGEHLRAVAAKLVEAADHLDQHPLKTTAKFNWGGLLQLVVNLIPQIIALFG